MNGRLIGVGLGPGDPELMSLKAARSIAEAPVIAYPALPGTESFARRIAAGQIGDGTHEIVIEVPMTRERGPAQAAYDLGASRIAEALDQGLDVAVLCEGDPFFYGSFMYLHARLADSYEVDVIPGITSIAASTARLGLPLTARNESLVTIPAPLDDATILQRMDSAEAVAILKLGRHAGRIRRLLEARGLASRARYIEHATLPDERALTLAEMPDPAPYFSMIIVTKGADPWL